MRSRSTLRNNAKGAVGRDFTRPRCRQAMSDSPPRLVSVVDDDASLRRALRNLLSSVGLRVETFASAEEFLSSAHREDTGCLVLDLRMSGMQGFDLLRHLATSATPIPVVILTAHGTEEAREQCLQAGAVAFLRKPFQASILLDAVRTALHP